MKELPLDDRFKKAIAVIASCTTYQQLQIAVNYAELFLDSLHRGKNFNINLYEQISLYQDILTVYLNKQQKEVLHSHMVDIKPLVNYHKTLHKYL